MVNNIIGTYFYPDEMKDYALVEGDITMSEGINCETGKRVRTLHLENEVRENTFLEFTAVEDEQYGMICMQPAETAATHINMYEPEFEVGFIPQEELDDGEYPRRHVACGQFRAGREYRLPLSATNAAISVNDRLELISATGGLDKASSSTCVVALESKMANEGGEIFVHLLEPKIPVASG